MINYIFSFIMLFLAIFKVLILFYAFLQKKSILLHCKIDFIELSNAQSKNNRPFFLSFSMI